ncbi:hypothetical protein RJ55_02304 [Drechmeria coniospora]|nr:hypothetical protein RJ55_02304 [Drechmeria coniospora]
MLQAMSRLLALLPEGLASRGTTSGVRMATGLRQSSQREPGQPTVTRDESFGVLVPDLALCSPVLWLGRSIASQAIIRHPAPLACCVVRGREPVAPDEVADVSDGKLATAAQLSRLPA